MVPPGAPGSRQDVLGLSLTFSLIARVPSGAYVKCMSSSSSVASDDSDGDAGLLSVLLGPPSFGSAPRTSELTLSSRDLSAAVAAGAMAPQARRDSVYMEAMGLWRPSLDPAGCP